MNKEHEIARKTIQNFYGRSVFDIIHEYMSKDYIYKLKEVEININYEKGNFELPSYYYNFIMTVVLIRYFKPDVIIKADIEYYSVQIDEFISLLDAIIKDAYNEYEYRSLWNKYNTDNYPEETILADLFKKPLTIKYLSLLYPIKKLNKQNFDENYVYELAFKDYCNSKNLSKKGVRLLFPALFVLWLNSYDPIRKEAIERPAYKLLLTLLLRPRTDKEYNKKSNFENRISKRIIDNPMYDANETEFDFDTDEVLGNIKREIRLVDKSIRSEKFWKVIHNYEEKRKSNERYPLTLENILYIPKLFERIHANDNDETLPSKTLSMIFINYKTSWIDLILLNKGLFIEATKIIGIKTKNVLSEYCEEGCYVSSDDLLYNIFDLCHISEGINNIINSLISEFYLLDNQKKEKGKSKMNLLKYKHNNAYDELFSELFDDKLINSISMLSLIKLAEYEYRMLS